MREPLPLSELPTQPCPTCGAPVNSLRAGAVLATTRAFYYFCSTLCRDRHHLPSETQTTPEADQKHIAERRDVDQMLNSEELTNAHSVHSQSINKLIYSLLLLPTAGALLPWIDQNPLWVLIGTACSLVSVFAAWHLGIRLPLLVPFYSRLWTPLACIAFCISAWLSSQSIAQARWSAVGAAFTGMAFLIQTRLVAKHQRLIQRSLHELELLLPQHATLAFQHSAAFDPKAHQRVLTHTLKVGDHIVIRAGELVAADATVVSGHAKVVQHISTERAETCSVGTPILAGASVIEGEVYAQVTNVANQRSLLTPRKILHDHPTFPSHLSRAAYIAERYAPWIAAFGVITALALYHIALPRALSLAGALLMASSPVAYFTLRRWPTFVVSVAGVARGVVFSAKQTIERSGNLRTVILCADALFDYRSTTLSHVVPCETMSEQQIVTHALSAEMLVNPAHPMTRAILGHAKTAEFIPLAMNEARYLSGQGIVCLSADAKPVLLGNRRLLLEHGVSFARFEDQARAFEAQGLIVIFLCVNATVQGMLAFSVPATPGARAAVQSLRDANIDVMLLSADPLDSALALAAQVDVTVVKGGLNTQERATYIEQLAQEETDFAVVGTQASDEHALRAAPIAFYLSDVSHTHDSKSISVISRSVRDVADAIWMASKGRHLVVRSYVGMLTLSSLLCIGVLTDWLPAFMCAPLGFVADAVCLPLAPSLRRAIRKQLRTAAI